MKPHNVPGRLQKCESDCEVYEWFMLITADSTELSKAWLRLNFELSFPQTEELMNTGWEDTLPCFPLNKLVFKPNELPTFVSNM